MEWYCWRVLDSTKDEVEGDVGAEINDHGCFDSSLQYEMFWRESLAKYKAIIIPTYVESILNILFTVIFSRIYSRFGPDCFQNPL